MSVELATQVGALVGTSLLLFLATYPNQKQQQLQRDPDLLTGVRRYSSYHRKRLLSSASSSSSSSSVESSTATTGNRRRRQ